MSDPAYEAGLSVRREVLGDAHVDRALESATEFTEPFQEFITRFAWGGVWTRPGLDRETRSAVTLAVLTALGRENEIALHVRAARRRSARCSCTRPYTRACRPPTRHSRSRSGRSTNPSRALTGLFGGGALGCQLGRRRFAGHRLLEAS